MSYSILMMNSSYKNICQYCGANLLITLICSNVKCHSHDFSLGNRIFLYNHPEYGTGFIDKIVDYKSAYEFCSDTNCVEEIEDINDENLFYEKPRYRIKFKIYSDQIVPVEELRHEIYRKGERIRTKFGIGIIRKVNLIQSKNHITYDVIFEDQNVKNLEENEILEYIFEPVDSFFKNELSTPVSFTLNMFGKILFSTYSSNTIKFVTNSRLSLMPHQVFIAHELIMGHFPRYILADEVGLGKTIEAGIYVKEMISRSLVKKILVVVPASLVNQWIFEFDNKFSIKLEKFDAQFIKFLDRRNHPNMFFRTDTQKEYPYLICSLQSGRLEKYRKILTSLYWDIVIFDEAHHLRRHVSGLGKYNPTLSYTLGKRLSEKSRSILLLTATPIQLNSFDLFSLLQLVRPDVFINFGDFEEERRKIPLIKMLVNSLNNYHNLNMFQKENIVELIYGILKKLPLIKRSATSFYNGFTSDESYVHNLVKTTLMDSGRQKKYTYTEIKNAVQSRKERQHLIFALNKHHFLSNFMYRNRKRVVFPKNFVKRIVKNIKVVQTEEEENLYNEIRLYLAKTYNQALDPEHKNVALGFVLVILQKLLTSSPPALIYSIEKRIEKIKIAEINAKKRKSGIKGTLVRDFETDSFEDFGDFENNDFENNGKIFKDSSAEIKEEEFSNRHMNILEEFLNRLKKLETDSKMDSLIRVISEIFNPKNSELINNKVIIFTQFKKTLFYIKNKLSKKGYKIEEFHGDLTREMKELSTERFRTKSEIMISTEVGGEGRNFQFCNVLLNYDLPWNPMKLEQRIGRLDRIGQKKDVFIYNFTTINTVESRIMEVLIDRINLFKESIGDLEPIVANVEKSITEAIFSGENIVNSVNSFEMAISENQNEMEAIEAQLDDFVLDKRSFQMSEIKTTEDTPRFISGEDIQAFITLFLENYTFYDSADKLANSITKNEPVEGDIPYFDIVLEENTRKKLGLGLNSNFFRGVFNLSDARKQEKLEFFALGHPLVNSLFNFCKNEDIGPPATILPLNLRMLLGEKRNAAEILSGKTGLYFFVFESEYCGIVLEKLIRPVVITEHGVILKNVSDFLSKPANFSRVLNLKTSIFKPKLIQKIKDLSKEKIKKLIKIAKKYFEGEFSSKKRELGELNDHMFEKELQRTISLHEYKKHHILNSIELNQTRLDYLKNRTPTKRQWLFLEKIEDEERKKEREEEFNSIIREKQNLNIENDDLFKHLDDLEFDLPEDIRRLEFYKKLSQRTHLSLIALIVGDESLTLC
ncbi:MAG: DEAD/DEAH box helicase [Promethearchaeota archaeon]